MRWIIVFQFCIAFTHFVNGAPYWVSPTGTVSWEAAKSSQILNGTACASLKTANTNASAGDTIILRNGVYATGISPSGSGTGEGHMIVYQAHTGETPTITGSDNSGTFFGIFINNKHYIKVDGVLIKDVDRWMSIRNSSSYIEIANSTFTDTDGRCVMIYIWGQCDGGTPYTCHVSNIWFHNNIVYNNGHVGNDCDDVGSLMYVGTPTSGDSNSNYITIENNTFYWGAHHCVETFTKYNVLRNNYFHNEGFMDPPNGISCTFKPGENGKYGNRTIEVYDGHDRDGLFNLIENNRFGTTGCPPDDNGGNAFILVSKKNIARYNYMFNSMGDGIYFKQGAKADSDSNAVYNNTVFKTGIAPEWRTDFRRGGISISDKSVGNRIKNNLIFLNGEDFKCIGSGCRFANNFIENNWTTDSGNPLFNNTDVSNPMNDTLPDLTLQPGSPCINEGIHLTITSGANSKSTALKVVDALYFQDGSWGSSLASLESDWIAVGTVDNVAEIASIDYKTNTITLATPLTWEDKAKVWLYRDSSGRVVLKGEKPDIGADESNYFLCLPKEFEPKPTRQ
ncbi:MAG: hypothetical protein JXB48_24650 [Candidatus Latescibacteria bacterium]|nr:hypothetical protein [Candidatus Latescibacterota bacterium]